MHATCSRLKFTLAGEDGARGSMADPASTFRPRLHLPGRTVEAVQPHRLRRAIGRTGTHIRSLQKVTT